VKYEILYYDKLDVSGLNKKFNKTVNQLSVGDFNSADVIEVLTNHINAQFHRTLNSIKN